ncbi:GH25 family lysozyme M1 (1,4-beta-N-acetylmuramidase) [Ruminococcaceae bacterium R-25]|nr:GH25 family lysozyme M1 (1,4-beta-N-acetylmuramidase) [Ruminococcaceae bacterium R-25]SUQ22358.1 Lyzozyme M1 (1,4-beta-N-acetylmuramidase), GH25 family [Oscillospiraceae bacterium]
MQKRATKEKHGFFERFCTASEKPARISLILAAAIGFATIGSVCAAAIMSNRNVDLPSENIELNAAQQYLDRVSFEATSSAEETSAESTKESSEESSGETLETKRGALTGENVADINDLKSLSNEDLLKAVKQGKVKAIEKKNIKQDQSQNVKTTHKGTIADAPKATSTPKPQPTKPAATNVPTPTLGPVTVYNYELGIDISEFQGDINWTKVKNDGIKFAFIRCGGRGYTKGTCYEDKKFGQNVKRAQAAGVKVGVYFFSQAITVAEAVEEASLTIAMCKNYNIDLPVVMDWETGSGYRTQPLKGELFAQVIDAYCTLIKQNGYTPCVYLCTDDINNRLGKYSGQILGKYKLWYAYPYSCYWPASKSFKSNYYQTGDTIPPRSFAFEYWQYSWHGKVAGIGTEVDLNIRILGKTTLNSPQINITNKTITTETGQSINPMDGVKAKTSQGVVTTDNLSYAIRNEAGQTVTVDQAKQTAGKYTITYTFKDPFRGTITDTATWEVKAASSTTPSTSPSTTPSTGDTTLTPSPTGSAAGTETPTPTPESSTSNTPSATPTPEASPTETVNAPTSTSTSTPSPTPTNKPEDNNGDNG